MVADRIIQLGGKPLTSPKQALLEDFELMLKAVRA
jgi:hypothetical protein